ncbi:ATP-binding protein [Streptomyces sp. NPDC058391]|uniref:ATP-binding protein n=1 Tax=Streptomyces sp. NPDC058391 TaxID=3346476 RepID=UPI00365D1A2C
MGNLPEETTSFVGRGTELVRLERALTEHRLITLTGSGGVGKSRLALRAAGRGAASRGRYPDGVWWADLSSLYDDRLLLATVSDAVGLSDYFLRMPIEALCEWLADRRLLLVLDSCERMVPACGHLVGELLTAAPGLTVLTTSRQPLGAKGEHLLDVPPLPLEGDEDALQLFRDRAADAAPQVSLDDPGTAAAAVQICRRLEGIPLAVELACARLDENSVEQIADLLTFRLDLLTNENAWPERHRALRTAIGWSHELCAPLERLLWARLSVFRGDIDPVDARAVCAGGPLTTDDVGTALAGLVAQSVVRLDGTRYRMLDTIREYGAMWLAELGEERLLADRHAAYFAELARQAHDAWLGPAQVAWYRRIADTHADLCAALNHLLAEDPEAAVHMAGRVGFFWFCCGHLHEARIYLERALDADRTAGPHRTRALWALGMTVVLQGDHETAHRLGERCGLAAWHEQDPEAMLSAAYLLGITYLMMSRPQAALTVAERALLALPGEPFGSPSRLRCRLIRIFALTATGKLDEAGTEAADLRRLCLDHDEYWTRSYADYQLALVRLLQDRPYEAEAHARSMIGAKQLLGDSFGIALGLDLLAAAIAAQGDGERAAHAYGTGQAYWRMVGHPQRGTPELAPVRAECERRARAAAGNLAYDDAFHRGLVDDGESGLARALRGHLPSET